MMTRPKFLKTFADANPLKTQQLENEILQNVDYSQEAKGKPYCFSRKFSFNLTILPPWQQYDRYVQDLWNSAVCDLDMNDDLEREGIINWCPKTNRLFPIQVKRDGNCLIHAICTAIWGIEDVHLNVRRLLSITLQSDPHHVFQTRWKQYQRNQDREMFNKPELTPVNLGHDQWEQEWAQVLYSARGDPAAATQMAAMPYIQLEAIHVYVLANILKRSIIILGKDTVNTFSGTYLQDNNLIGIYLPLERDPEECCQIPVILGLSMNHFCPLLGRDTQFDVGADTPENYLPLIMRNGSSLPIRFLMAGTEERQANELLRKYLKLKEYRGSMGAYVGAVIDYNPMPQHLNVLKDYEHDVERRIREHSQTMEQNIPPGPQQIPQLVHQPVLNIQQQAPTATASARAVDPVVQQASNIFKSVQCKTQGCEFFGNPAQGGMCTKCLNKYLRNENSQLQQPAAEINIQPSAPPPSMPVDQGYTDISMMGELCHNGCGFRCSVKTFPFCHECAEKKRREVIQERTSPREDPNLAAGSTPGVATNKCQPGQEIKMNNLAMPENTEVAIPEANLFGSGQQLSSPMQESCGQIKPNEVVCINAPCTGKGKPNQGNRCNKCFVENASQNAVAGGTAIAPIEVTPVAQTQGKTQPVESSSLPQTTGRFVKCISPRCGNTGLPGNHGYCTECAIRFIEGSSLQMAFTAAVDEQNRSQSAQTSDVSLQKIICSTPGCDGIRLKDDEYGLCKHCHLQNQKSSSPVENTAMGELSGSDESGSNLIESSTPSGVSLGGKMVVEPHHKKKCASPMCREMIYPPNNLCFRCLEILRKNLPAQNNVSTTALPTMPERRNRTAPLNPVVVPAPLDRPKSQSAPHGRKCIMPGCTKYGDPATNDMCTNCYTYQLAQVRTAPTVFQQPEHGQPMEVGEDNQFLKMMSKVENTRRIAKLCKKANCSNYGNTAKEGFCNTCYPDYMRMQSAAR